MSPDVISTQMNNAKRGDVACVLLRPACEEFICLRYLQSIAPEDANRLVTSLGARDVFNSLKAQRHFGGVETMETFGLKTGTAVNPGGGKGIFSSIALCERVQPRKKRFEGVSGKPQGHRFLWRCRREQAFIAQVIEEPLRRPDRKARDPRCLAAFDLAAH